MSEGDHGESDQWMTYPGWFSRHKKKSVDRLIYVQESLMVKDQVKDQTEKEHEALMERMPSLCIETVHPMIAMQQTTNPDVLYYREEKKESDWEKFKKGMDLDMQGCIENNSFQILERDKVPDDIPIPPSLWSFKRKRRISDQKIMSWKERINC